jgi:hypothetical protein
VCLLALHKTNPESNSKQNFTNKETLLNLKLKHLKTEWNLKKPKTYLKIEIIVKNPLVFPSAIQSRRGTII